MPMKIVIRPGAYTVWVATIVFGGNLLFERVAQSPASLLSRLLSFGVKMAAIVVGLNSIYAQHRSRGYILSMTRIIATSSLASDSRGSNGSRSYTHTRCMGE